MAKSKNSSPPGFYSYGESYPIIQKLTDEEAGKLFKAKYDYWFNDREPTFESNPILETVWTFEKSKLDSDRYTYYLNSVRNSYNSYCRDHKDDALSKDLWFSWKKRLLEQEGIKSKAFDVVNIEDLIG